MANTGQNRAYLPHLITDPHSHPILLLQKLSNISISYNVFHGLIKQSRLEYLKNKDILIITDLPDNCISNELIQIINRFDFPILIKSKDYHTFVVNDRFRDRCRELNSNVLKEEFFSPIDRLVLRYLKEKIDFIVVIDKFLKNDICKTIDAFTTKDFYEFYIDMDWKEYKDFEIFFLLDSEFFLSNPEVLLDKKVLGIKFFIDGTFTSNTAWETLDKKNLFLDEKKFSEILDLLEAKFTGLSYIYLAFHCVGKLAFKFLVKEIAPKVLKQKNFILRVEHCSSIQKEDLLDLIKVIAFYKAYGRVFLVLNPENTSFSIDNLYTFRDYFYVCYASDAPIYELDLKNSIFNFFGGSAGKEFQLKIAMDVFKFNKLLFTV